MASFAPSFQKLLTERLSPCSQDRPGHILGRVIAINADHLSLTIDDGTSTRHIDWPPNQSFCASLKPGDFLKIETSTQSAQPSLIHVLEHTKAGKEGRYFPSVQGDFYRLHKQGRTRFSNLHARGLILQGIRAFFQERNFTEIEAPLMVPSPGLELHLQAVQIDQADPKRYLITSPEYQLKRLLSAGFQRIYSLGKVFRQGEEGPHHNPEFTMLEWYRAFDSWEAVAKDVEDLFAHLAETLYGTTKITYQGKILDFQTPWPKATVSEVVHRYAGILLRGDESVEELVAKVKEKGYALPSPPYHWDDVFFAMFMDHVEPHLSQSDPLTNIVRPITLYDWPTHLCALARKNPHNVAVVERFEAYAGNLELCNGFGELIDPMEQKERCFKDLENRTKRNLPLYPLDEKFLSALEEGMPPSGGVALGIDRLMMLLLDAAMISDVLPFTTSEL